MIIRLHFLDHLETTSIGSSPPCPESQGSKSGGGLYHIITRGNNRRKTFRSHDDYLRFTSILAQQKMKLPFYLYAYCLMPNHVHLLIEMQDAPISRIMQRVLTSYSQYHNRKYTNIGHLFSRTLRFSAKQIAISILCVRYIHLNLRARIVKRPENYEYSGHWAYLGLDKTGLVDTEPVLRHFGASRKRAIETYIRFVESSLAERSQDEYYSAAEVRLLGSEEFLKEIRHRMGDHRWVPRVSERTSIDDLLTAAEASSGLSRQELCSKSKNRRTVAVKEAAIVIGRENGITNRELAEALGLGASAVTRRVQAERAWGRRVPIW
jgi:REP element-mobilizing transposase RayT